MGVVKSEGMGAVVEAGATSVAKHLVLRQARIEGRVPAKALKGRLSVLLAMVVCGIASALHLEFYIRRDV